MADPRVFDVIVVGGGIAGSTLGGVLARAGLGVLVLEKEARFRDRVRGEGTYPYGVNDARAMGLDDLLAAAGTVPLSALQFFEHRERSEARPYAPEVGPALSFSHTRFQETAFTWSAEQGATTLRPAKGVAFSCNGRPAVTVAHGDEETTYRTRLVVGADGRLSGVRRWTGGDTETDAEHHRFGGVLVSGVQTDDRDTDNVAWIDGEALNWFAAGPVQTRLYVVMSRERLKELGVDRSFDAVLRFAEPLMPEGALTDVRQEGPIAFFPNSDIWATKIAGNGVVLIGDAAGAPDPTVGQGTPLLFHDVRALSELLLSERDWDTAIEEYAARRRRYFDVILALDRWNLVLDAERGEEADRLRESHRLAREADPTLGGFALLDSYGPDGLVADEAARRHFYGLDSSARL